MSGTRLTPFLFNAERAENAEGHRELRRHAPITEVPDEAKRQSIHGLVATSASK